MRLINTDPTLVSFFLLSSNLQLQSTT